jgi:hypothetical protein
MKMEKPSCHRAIQVGLIGVDPNQGGSSETDHPRLGVLPEFLVSAIENPMN